MKHLLALMAICFPVMALSQADLEEQARQSLVMMETAAAELAEVESGRDRVKALTEAISAHEEGLTALRSGMRRISAREAELSAKLRQQDNEIAALLGALQILRSGETPVILAHPGGPVGSVRAGMMLSESIPALNAQASVLRADVEELTSLRDLQENAVLQLEAGAQRLQLAREDLNLAIADRTELPKRFVSDPVREAVLIASADSMAQFADGLDRIAVDQIAPAPDAFEIEKGGLPLPVTGSVIRDADEPDASGLVRPGVILSVLPQAVVISPTTATVRYTGPLLDYGQVVILEPVRDVLFVFAGLETLYVSAGDVVDAGAPLGLVGGATDKNAALRSTDGEETGAAPAETLYIEVRQDNNPEDPNLWFRMDKDG